MLLPSLRRGPLAQCTDGILMERTDRVLTPQQLTYAAHRSTDTADTDSRPRTAAYHRHAHAHTAYTHTRTLHAYALAHKRAHCHTHTHIRACTVTYTHTHTHTHTQIHPRAHTHSHTHKHIQVHAPASTHAHTPTHTHTHTHTHTLEKLPPTHVNSCSRPHASFPVSHFSRWDRATHAVRLASYPPPFMHPCLPPRSGGSKTAVGEGRGWWICISPSMRPTSGGPECILRWGGVGGVGGSFSRTWAPGPSNLVLTPNPQYPAVSLISAT